MTTREKTVDIILGTLREEQLYGTADLFLAEVIEENLHAAGLCIAGGVA